MQKIVILSIVSVLFACFYGCNSQGSNNQSDSDYGYRHEEYRDRRDEPGRDYRSQQNRDFRQNR